jgi:hypothetical protein
MSSLSFVKGPAEEPSAILRFTSHCSRLMRTKLRLLEDFSGILLEKRTGRPPLGGRPARLPSYGAD